MQIVFQDNLDILNLIESKSNGIFNMLEDAVIVNVRDARGAAVKMPIVTLRTHVPVVQTDDNGFFSNLEKEHSATRHFVQRRDLPASVRDSDTSRIFGIRHYAGEVAYSVLDFVSKNKDDLTRNLTDLVAISRNEFIKDKLFSGIRAGASATKKTRSATEASSAAHVALCASDDPCVLPCSGAITVMDRVVRCRRRSFVCSWTLSWSSSRAARRTSSGASSPTPPRRRCCSTARSVLFSCGTRASHRLFRSFKKVCARGVATVDCGYHVPRVGRVDVACTQGHAAAVVLWLYHAPGYPFRYTYRDFCRRYHMLAASSSLWTSRTHTLLPDNGAFRELARAIVKDNEDEVPELKDVQFGRTKVLYRGDQDRQLEVRCCGRDAQCCIAPCRAFCSRWTLSVTPLLLWIGCGVSAPATTSVSPEGHPCVSGVQRSPRAPGHRAVASTPGPFIARHAFASRVR